jgi:hypothetical protein
VIAAALGVPKAMVSKSPLWDTIAKALRFRRDEPPRLDLSKKIGLEIAEEEKAASEGESVVEEASRREAAHRIRLMLMGNPDDAELLVDQLECGSLSPEEALAIARTMRGRA